MEWSERVANALPADTVYVSIYRCAEDSDWRSIVIEGGDER